MKELDLESPEGVVLKLELADRGARAGAFVLDYTIASFVTGLVLLLGGVADARPAGEIEGLAGGYGLGLAVVTAFLLQNFYFIGSELWLNGQTIGKRTLGLRVVARDGGQLDAGRIYARNLLRDLELFVPLAFLLRPESLLGDSPLAARLIALVWLGLLACFPLLNPEGARVGDLVAGTLVVAVPRLELLPDLAEGSSEKRAIDFTDAELDIYGEHELQVLEGVLRRSELGTQTELLETIAHKIRRKIGRKGKLDADPEQFLRAFYVAQRRRLEQRMLVGKRRARKRRGAG